MIANFFIKRSQQFLFIKINLFLIFSKFPDYIYNVSSDFPMTEINRVVSIFAPLSITSHQYTSDIAFHRRVLLTASFEICTCTRNNECHLLHVFTSYMQDTRIFVP